MAYQGVLDDIRTCARRGIPGRVPVFGISQELDLRLAGVTHDAYGRDVESMVKVHEQAVKRFDFDWIFHIPDDYIELEPLGIRTKAMDKAPRAVVKYPELSKEAVDGLKMPDFRTEGRMPAFLEALERLKAKFGNTICLTGNVAGPFGSVALTWGIDQALLLTVDDPKLFRTAMDFFVDLQIGWGRAQIEAGADAIWLGDCVATSGFISVDHYIEFALQPTKKVAASLKETGAIVFYHGGETALDHLEHMIEVGGDALSIGERTDLAPIKHALGERSCLMGNIDGIQILQHGSVEQVRQETARVMNTGKEGGGYIFNSGEGISYHAKEENMHAMIETARDCGSY